MNMYHFSDGVERRKPTPASKKTGLAETESLVGDRYMTEYGRQEYKPTDHEVGGMTVRVPAIRR